MANQSRLESIQLREAAVAKEDETAVYMLGAAYANGRVRVPVDLEGAVELWAASSAHGCALDGSPDKLYGANLGNVRKRREQRHRNSPRAVPLRFYDFTLHASSRARPWVRR